MPVHVVEASLLRFIASGNLARGFDSTPGKSDGIGNEPADDYHDNHCGDKDDVGNFLPEMHAHTGAGSQGRVGNEAGDEKEKSVSGQQIIRQRVHFSQGDHDADQSDDGQTDADHGGGYAENMDTDIFLEVILFGDGHG